MGIKENFTQAVKELAGGGKGKEADKKSLPVEELKKAVEEDNAQQHAREITLNGGDGVVDTTPAAEAFFAGEEVPSSPFAQTVAQTFRPASDGHGAPATEGVPETGGGFGADEPARAGVADSGVFPVASMRSARGGEDNEITVISRNTTVDGNIRSFADMSIDGDIKGDVETTKNIDLNGKIVGNITCNNALMHMSQIQGNIRMKGNVNMKRDTLLIGDLMSTYAEVNGKIKGNLDIVGKAELRGDAVVFGDISAATSTVEDGAIIQGYVSTTFLNKEESRNLFPEAIVIGDSQ
ncbi:MAG: polymer-forming cytoskeletal protein [Oscillospiraceae bacterium]|jgi:cytoskeletal protein CcmA (bactofilin family)|nr:polymer-forming cytoskeletal protein [Oscillospiraceae bacterium]